jgi:hypothetical protein
MVLLFCCFAHLTQLGGRGILLVQKKLTCLSSALSKRKREAAPCDSSLLLSMVNIYVSKVRVGSSVVRIRIQLFRSKRIADSECNNFYLKKLIFLLSKKGSHLLIPRPP